MRTFVRGGSLLCGLIALLCGLAGLWAHGIPDDAFERDARERLQALRERFANPEQLTAAGRQEARKRTDAMVNWLLWLREPPGFGGLVATGLGLLVSGRPRRRAKSSARAGLKAGGRGEGGSGKRERRSRAAAEVAVAEERRAPGPSARDVRRLLKQASQVQKEDGAEAAGDFLLNQGLGPQALELFEREGLLARAAEVLQDQNRFGEAAELYEKAGKLETAAAIYAQVERYEDSGRCYQAAQKTSVAAEMYERGGQHRKAGECYQATGFRRQAAEAFGRAGSEAAAAENMKAVFDEEHLLAAKSEDKLLELRALAKKAGEIFFKLERFEEAEDILVRSGSYQTAAKIAFHRGAFDKAAEWFGRVNRADLQARALAKLGDEVGAARALAGHLRDQGQVAEAAAEFLKAGEHGEAATLLRTLERFDEAGEAFLQANDYFSAAEMFRAGESFERAGAALERAQRFREAAECYARAGSGERQAELLERAQEWFEAGSAHAAQGRADDAIRVLQQVEPEHAKYLQACALLGQLFQEKGMNTLSLTKLEQATGGAPVNRANAEAYYSLACLRQSCGSHAQAAELFEKLLAFDYQFRDAAQRLEAVRAAPAERSSPAVLPPGEPERYRVIREIGRGGMGVVYLARDVLLERDVAYKVLPEQLRESPEALRGFLREAKAAAQLNHPNIVTIYDVGESAHGFYLAMEYVEGTTLKAIVQKRGPIAPGGVMYILRQMGEALGYAHGRKVVHRDIKTANTMWTADRQVKIMDFGLAKLMEEVRNATTTISGTPFYMSPEQTLGRNVDHRTDLYSLGVTLYELVTGELPFRKGNVPYHHVHTPPRDPRELTPAIPEPLAAVILRCLEKAPEDRYGSARELVDDLAQRLAAAGASGS